VHAVGERGTPRAGRLAPWTPLSSLAGRVWLETYIFGMAGQERGEAQLGLPLVDHRLPSDVLNAHIAELCPSHEIEWQLGGRGRAEVRGPAGKRTLLIRTPPVRGQVSYFIALHEIGHLVGPPSGLSCEGRPSVPQSFSWPPKTAQPTGRNPIELSLSWIPRMAQTARPEGEPGRTVRAR
jgi:hypothetical protein